MEIFRVKNLSFSYPNTETQALSALSFSIKRGEFLVLAGATGSGKTTLLRMLKPALSPKGERIGEILYLDQPLLTLPERTSASEIGYVAQDPDMQIVTDKVWHELSFGLESLGLSKSEMARRVAEAASFFGIDSWFQKNTTELSGGQKQLLSLAAVTAMQPQVLLLDEPAAQLDPVAAKNFFDAVKRLNRELGITVVLSEHRLEDVLPLCDRVMLLDKGRLHLLDTPKAALSGIPDNSPLFFYLPASSRLWSETGRIGDLPLSVQEGRDYLETCFENSLRSLDTEEKADPNTPSALEWKDVFFRYEKAGTDALSGLSLDIREGEVFCILGPNASGKTTALFTAAGLRRPYSGKVKVFGQPLKSYKNGSLYQSCLSLLPQDVSTVFLKSTVEEELKDAKAQLSELPFDLSSLLSLHPYDLSGGERQLVALAKVLANHPRLLLLDEPTKGLDPYSKERLKKVIQRLHNSKMTIVIVSHDVEFCADVADRCALLFRGECVSIGTPRELFSQGVFYTTAVSKITRGFFERTISVTDAALLCRKNGRKA